MINRFLKFAVCNSDLRIRGGGNIKLLSLFVNQQQITKKHVVYTQKGRLKSTVHFGNQKIVKADCLKINFISMLKTLLILTYVAYSIFVWFCRFKLYVSR